MKFGLFRVGAQDASAFERCGRAWRCHEPVSMKTRGLGTTAVRHSKTVHDRALCGPAMSTSNYNSRALHSGSDDHVAKALSAPRAGVKRLGPATGNHWCSKRPGTISCRRGSLRGNENGPCSTFRQTGFVELHGGGPLGQCPTRHDYSKSSSTQRSGPRRRPMGSLTGRSRLQSSVHSNLQPRHGSVFGRGRLPSMASEVSQISGDPFESRCRLPSAGWSARRGGWPRCIERRKEKPDRKRRASEFPGKGVREGPAPCSNLHSKPFRTVSTMELPEAAGYTNPLTGIVSDRSLAARYCSALGNVFAATRSPPRFGSLPRARTPYGQRACGFEQGRWGHRPPPGCHGVGTLGENEMPGPPRYSGQGGGRPSFTIIPPGTSVRGDKRKLSGRPDRLRSIVSEDGSVAARPSLFGTRYRCANLGKGGPVGPGSTKVTEVWTRTSLPACPRNRPTR